MNMEQFTPHTISSVPHLKLFKSVVTFNNYGLNFFERALYCVLFDLLHHGDNILPTTDVICAHMGVCPKTARTAMTKLHRQGIITIRKDRSPEGYRRKTFTLKNFAPTDVRGTAGEPASV